MTNDNRLTEKSLLKIIRLAQVKMRQKGSVLVYPTNIVRLRRENRSSSLIKY